jgi:hypothetical protein
MATLTQRRKTDRERLKRWRKKKLAEGNKQFLIMLTPEAQKVLNREKARTGKPYVQIINSLIIGIEDGPPSASDKTEARPAWQQKMIRRIKKLRSEGYTYTAIAKKFNDEEIKTFKGFGKWRSSAVSYLFKNG